LRQKKSEKKKADYFADDVGNHFTHPLSSLLKKRGVACDLWFSFKSKVVVMQKQVKNSFNIKH
jgi:hypothetical protein